jgi:nucleoid-associated protein YgaU
LNGRQAVIDRQREDSIGNKKRGGGFILILAVLILPGAAYLALQQSGSPVKLASLPEPSKPARPKDLPGQRLPGPSFDAVSADENGMLVAAGKGPAGWNIRLQNAAQTLGDTKASEDGEWVLIPDQPLDPGDYVLSLVAQDSSGQQSVAGRHTFALTVAPRRKIVKLPSRQMDAPSLAAAEARPATGPEAAKTTKVKPGDSLWSIAHRHLGSGNRYPEIVGANKSQIKDPNLIYPEQQFAMPH